MPSRSECRVDEKASALGREKLDDLVEENRDMPSRCRVTSPCLRLSTADCRLLTPSPLSAVRCELSASS